MMPFDLLCDVYRNLGLVPLEGDRRMGEVLRAFWLGLREAPQAFIAPLFAAVESVRRVFEAHDSRDQKDCHKRRIPNQ
jgi:hypothetical protein